MGFPFEKPQAEVEGQTVAPAAVTPAAAPAAVAPAAVAPAAVAPAAAPAAVAPQAAPEVAPEAKERKKTVRKATKMIEQDDILFVRDNVKTMSYVEMAESRQLTKFQVNRILMDLKKKMRIAAKGTPKEAAVEEYIKTTLSRPEDAGVGRKGSGKVAQSIDSVVDDILGGIA